jgi:hypothetical protein
LFVVATRVVVGTTTLLRFPAVFNADLIDTDSYMRMVRIDQLLETGNWFDESIQRSNAPYGEVLHWTRPLDVLVLGLATPFAMAGATDSLFWGGALVGPVALLALGILVGWAGKPILTVETVPLAMLAVLAQPALLNYALPGRVDHHVLMVIAVVLALGFGIRAVREEGPHRNAFYAGIALGLGIWVSVEVLIAAMLFVAGFALAGLLLAGTWLKTAETVTASIAVTCALAVMVERGLGFLAVNYRSISVAHVCTFAIAWLLLAGLRRWDRTRSLGRVARVGSGIGAGVVGGGILLALFPGVLASPEQAYDPLVRSLMFSRIVEMQPLWPESASETGFLFSQLGTALLALPAVAWLIAKSPSQARRGWVCVGIGLITYVALSLRAFRFAPYAETRNLASPVRRSLLRVGSAGVALIGLTLLGSLARSDELDDTISSNECHVETLSHHLNAAFAPGSTILGFLDFGPEVLYRTSHQVVAAPYGNEHGFLDSIAILAGPDAARSRRLLQERSIDAILLCPPADRSLFANGGATLYRSLVAGDTPAGISRVELPTSVGAFQLYSVDSQTQ